MIAPVSSAERAGLITQAKDRSSVSREQFLQILVAELTSQDPMAPLDNSQFVQQLVGLQSLEQTAALTDSLKTFERFMQMSSGSALIGKKIKGLSATGDSVEGVVSKVTLEDGKVNLVVGSDKVAVNSVTEIVQG